MTRTSVTQPSTSRFTIQVAQLLPLREPSAGSSGTQKTRQFPSEDFQRGSRSTNRDLARLIICSVRARPSYVVAGAGSITTQGNSPAGWTLQLVQPRLL